MEETRNDNQENEDRSKSSHDKIEEPYVAVVTNQPGVGMMMGRFPEPAQCPWCGAEGTTNIKYRRGAKAMCCCCCFSAHAYLFVGFLCMIGFPSCTKKTWWDVEHFCHNCTRKIGYNVMKDKCCCWTSNETKRMPQN